MPQLNNTVELVNYYGSDEIIAAAAWTSTSRDLTDEKRNRIPALINMLWSEGHHTPFERPTLHFLINTDIATHIHLLKHRIGVSMNAESARYKELKEDKYLVPDDWHDVQTADRQNRSWADRLEDFTCMGNMLYHQALAELTPVLGRKRAKESARFFKTYNSQIQADISFNMRSFANFQKLRNSEHAQKEVRELATEMLKLVESIDGNPFEHTLTAMATGERNHESCTMNPKSSCEKPKCRKKSLFKSDK